MKSTSSRHADYLAHDNRAVLHALEDGRFQPLFDRNPDEQSPAGGVSSTVRDLAEWVKFLLAKGLHQGNQLASPEALLAAMSAHSFNAPAHRDDSRPGFYGYGFRSEEHTSELQSLMRISYAVFCLQITNTQNHR